MNSPKPPHIAITPQPLAGRQLPADFGRAPLQRSSMGTLQMDSRNLENLWRNPQWTSKLNSENVSNLIAGARLTASGI